jgi:hydrogenase/urease accessory protein HupE
MRVESSPGRTASLFTHIRRAAGIGIILTVAMAATAAPASAHGIDRTGHGVSDFLKSGVTYMFLGWDHLLFVAGILLLAREIRRAAVLISTFAAGHSITLIIATLATWRVDATVVDIVIALSLVFVGVVGWRGPPRRWGWFTAAVFGFGLVHGLGLATRLQALYFPDGGVLDRVIAFNVGVEIGQLLAILGIVVLGELLTHSGFLTERLTARAKIRLANGGLIAAGLVAAAILAVTGLSGPPGDSPDQALARRVDLRTTLSM